MAVEISRRMVLTGLGLLGPFGLDTDALWSCMLQGGVPFAPCSRYKSPLLCAESVKPDLRKMLRSGQHARAPLISQYALAATHMALTQAGLQPGKTIASKNLALVYGTSNGPGNATQEIYDDLLDSGPESVRPRVFQESVFNAPASLVSIHFGVQGPILAVPAGTCSGAFVLLHAELLLARTDVEAVIAVCADELCQGIQSALHLLRYHSPNDGGTAGPFPYDRRRNGCVMSEGAVALALEPADQAKARGASVLAELAGVGCANDAHKLVQNAADGRGLVTAIEACLADAEVDPEDVGLVLSGSACTAQDDGLEQAALTTIFGQRLPAMASSKGAIGLAMGASVFFDVVLAIEAIRRQTVPPTPGFKTPAEAGTCMLSTAARPVAGLSTVLCNAISTNGLYGTVLVRRTEW